MTGRVLVVGEHGYREDRLGTEPSSDWLWLVLLAAGIVVLAGTWKVVERLELREGGSGAHHWAWGVAKASAMLVALDLALDLLGAKPPRVERLLEVAVWVAGFACLVALVFAFRSVPEIDGRSPGADPNRRGGRRRAGGERIRMFVS